MQSKRTGALPQRSPPPRQLVQQPFGLGMVGIQLQDLFELREGFGPPIGLQQRLPEVPMAGHGLGLLPHQDAQVRNGLCRPPLSQTQGAEIPARLG